MKHPNNFVFNEPESKSQRPYPRLLNLKVV